MSLVAIGRNLSDFEVGCIGMISRYSSNGMVNLIMTSRSMNTKKNMIDATQRFMKFGSTKINFIDKFDESSVTQGNVNSLRSIIEKINPSLVILPFPETSIKQLSVVGHSSLLASRGIKNLLMYDISKNKKFLPNIFCTVETGNVKKSSSHISPLITNPGIKRRKQSLTKFYSHEIKARIVEPFKSYRLLLLDSSELT